MRTMTLLFCLMLVNCAGANAAHEMPAQAAAPAAAESSPPPRAVRTAAAKKDSKKRDDAKGDEQKEEWWKEGGVTREKINAMCWMKYETGRKDIQIDKRADLVNACVVQTLKEHPVR